MFTSLRVKLVMILIAITVTAVAISTGYTIRMQKQFALKQASERASEDLRLISSEIQTHLQWVAKDILVLRDLPQIHRLLEVKAQNAKANALKSVESAFLVLAEHHRIYHQIRFLDETGMEVIRVNFDGTGPKLVPISELQQKRHRYYFEEAVGLQNGQIFISPMDLNIEHGAIERPFVPTIRYATPVVDSSGKTRGIIVLNVLGATLLQVLEHQQKQVMQPGRRYYLLNTQGYFLFHPDQTKTFGFMLGSGERLERYESTIMKWFSGSDKESGVMVSISEAFQRPTVFAFQQIPIGMGLPDHHRFSLKTAKDLTADDTEIVADKDYWILLSAMDGAELLVGLKEYTTPFLFFTIFLLVGCILIAILVGVLVSRPVVSLAGAAKRIQDGDLSARAEINSRDEMGQFGRLFNNMAADLEKLINRIKASETRYRQLFENSRDCFFAADTSGRIVDMNRACTQLLGLSPEIDIPPNFNIPWYNEDSKDRQAFHEALYDTGFVKDYEVHLKRSDGSHLICFMTAHVRSKQDGTILGCEGGLRDITERRRRIMARRDFRRRLQEEIALAEERERRSMGEVLHDELAQNLALVQMKVQETEALLTEPTSDMKNALKESQNLLGQMIRQIRTMIFDLYPAILDEQGLIPAMQWYAQSFSERSGVVATVYELSASTNLTRPQEVYLFRTFKELLHNVWKHAEANEVVATVAGKDGRLRLIFDDDGKGFDPRAAFEFSPQLKGIGLFSIREWITNMDGNFSVESNEGKGTRVIIEIPLSQNAGEKY